jgi:hypothetical protein
LEAQLSRFAALNKTGLDVALDAVLLLAEAAENRVIGHSGNGYDIASGVGVQLLDPGHFDFQRDARRICVRDGRALERDRQTGASSSAPDSMRSPAEAVMEGLTTKDLPRLRSSLCSWRIRRRRRPRSAKVSNGSSPFI